MPKRAIGLLREVKNKWERRVPLCPADVQQLVERGVQVYVQPSSMRIFSDQEYQKVGATVQNDLSPANTIFGVKEFPHDQLIADKSYIMFSHVIS